MSADGEHGQSLRDEVASILSSGARVDRPADGDSPEAQRADVANLQAAVRELQHVAVRLAEELDRRG